MPSCLGMATRPDSEFISGGTAAAGRMRCYSSAPRRAGRRRCDRGARARRKESLLRRLRPLRAGRRDHGVGAGNRRFCVAGACACCTHAGRCGARLGEPRTGGNGSPSPKWSCLPEDFASTGVGRGIGVAGDRGLTVAVGSVDDKSEAEIHNSLRGSNTSQNDSVERTDRGTGEERARAGDPTAARSTSHPRLPAASAGRSARSTARHAATTAGAKSRRCHRSACGSTSASISRLITSTSAASQPPSQSLQLARTAARARLAQ